MPGMKMVMAHPPQRGDPATAPRGAPELTALVVVLGSDTAISGRYGQPQLLPDCAGQEAADGMRLPFRQGVNKLGRTATETERMVPKKVGNHCHQPNQPGHGPNFRLTRKVNGKTVSETFSSAAELRKAQCEVEVFHRFRQLSQKLLEVNERICRARPIEDTLSPQEKKRPKPSARKSRAR